MSVLTPTSLDAALAALAERPDASVLAGGTDFMVEVNFGHRRPSSVVALTKVPELRGWRREGDHLVLGGGLTYAEMLAPELAALAPALAEAARTVGSPQIRNAGTVGGNLGTGSPAGDALPVLSALDAVIVVASASGRREVPISEFFTGPKRTVLLPGELVVEVRVPVLRGPQGYLKVGVRNAMVIAVASLCLVVDLDGRSVRCALGAVGPTVLRTPEAEAFAAAQLTWDGDRVALADPADAARFGELVAEAARPIDDHRSTAAYRRRAVRVLGERALRRATHA